MAQVVGMPEFRAQCRFAKRELGDKLTRRVASQGAALVRDEARRIAQFHDITGEARKAIVTKERRAEPGKAIFQVGFRTHGVVRKRKAGAVVISSAFYVKFVESGTRQHLINRLGAYIANRGPLKGTQIRSRGTRLSLLGKRRARLAIHFGNPGLVLFRYSVKHPGEKAHPFLVRALQNVTNEILKNRDAQVTVALNNVARNASGNRRTLEKSPSRRESSSAWYGRGV